ncbi:MAG TPA: XdhC/CoxI family protein [Kofleriaceae bacterium]|nr:XdhC/CoxI family protein [Kofleriaceae bacterium]
MRHDLDDVLAQAAAWHAGGHGVAIATVVTTWGSSPRPPGSKLAVDDRGEFVGSVSGGCIEAAVVDAAVDLIAGRGEPRVLEFGVADETAWSVGLACGGTIAVYVGRITPALLEAAHAPRPIALATSLYGGAQDLIAAADPRARRAFANDRAEVIDGALIEPIALPLRLIIVGAVHVASPLAAMARLAGFAVTIVEPRRAWASAVRFPDESIVSAWPDVAVRELAPDARTAIVTLTHDPKLDDPALIAALASPAFYIGCLGSTRTHAARLERLAAVGDVARLHGPVGLPIGARSPAEIAISILGEIVRDLRKRA